MRKVMIIGATSAIAEATARLFAQRGTSLFLVGRNPERLEAICNDLRIRGASLCASECFDLNEIPRHAQLIDDAVAALGGLDTVLIAHGTLPDQKSAQQSVDLTLQEFQTNALSTLSLLTLLANRMEQQGHGCLAVISSVAGDRGRASNYVYGSAKAAVTAFTSGLRQRLHRAGVQVLTIKPGFVDTPMTQAFPKGALWAQPEQIAKGILRAIERRQQVVYLPTFWAFVMTIIRHLPEAIFVRLRL
jgi:decaprenylphospho-beta-D-erythro-pentofuranosid-2-ulose 2-reductase